MTGRAGRWLWAAYGLLMALGLAVYAAAPRVTETPARVGTRAAPEAANLAHVAQGARVVASSFMMNAHHHPLYLIDGEARPSPMEKWVAAADDAAPWIEVRLARRARLEALVLELAGAHGEPVTTNMANYEVACVDEGRVVASFDVVGNLDDRPRTALGGCEADAVRVRFSVGPERTPQALVRVFEARVLGAWL